MVNMYNCSAYVFISICKEGRACEELGRGSPWHYRRERRVAASVVVIGCINTSIFGVVVGRVSGAIGCRGVVGIEVVGRD